MQTVKFTILPHMIALIVLRSLLKRAVVEQRLDSLTYHPAAVEGKEKKTIFFSNDALTYEIFAVWIEASAHTWLPFSIS